jgi:hypothetical protein
VPVVFALDGKIGPPINIAAFVAGAHRNPTGPQPGQLTPNIPTKQLGPKEAAMQHIANPASKTIVIGLITCAAVLYVSNDTAAKPGIWIHHANAGHVSATDVDAALQNLGSPPPATVRVVFAHPGGPDSGYDASFKTMVAKKINDNSIIEIPNMLVPQFGADNFGQLGF